MQLSSHVLSDQSVLKNCYQEIWAPKIKGPLLSAGSSYGTTFYKISSIKIENHIKNCKFEKKFSFCFQNSRFYFYFKNKKWEIHPKNDVRVSGKKVTILSTISSSYYHIQKKRCIIKQTVQHRNCSISKTNASKVTFN